MTAPHLRASGAPTVTNLVRTFLAHCLEPYPDRSVGADALCAAYQQWSLWQGVHTLSDANLMRVAGAVLGQCGPDGPITTVTGYALREDPVLRFLLERTRLVPEAQISASALHVAYLTWADGAGRMGSGMSFRAAVTAMLAASAAGAIRDAGPVWMWRGLTLADGLPEDAVAPHDPTDAAALRALPLDRREVA